MRLNNTRVIQKKNNANLFYSVIANCMIIKNGKQIEQHACFKMTSVLVGQFLLWPDFFTVVINAQRRVTLIKTWRLLFRQKYNALLLHLNLIVIRMRGKFTLPCRKFVAIVPFLIPVAGWANHFNSKRESIKDSEGRCRKIFSKLRNIVL